jgi:TonB family protein
LRKFIIGKSEKNELSQGRENAKAQRMIYRKIFTSLRLCVCLLILIFPLAAQKLAVLAPEKNGRSQSFAEKLETELSSEFKILNSSLSETAFVSGEFEKPFNLTTEQARNIGAAIGCQYFLLVKSELLRRSTFGREEFYEAHSVVYLVGAKTGKLVFWNLEKFDADLPSAAEEKLFNFIPKLADQISGKIKETEKIEPAEKNIIAEIPAENTPEAKNFRPPLPYRRISPEYTTIADYYNVEATVDVSVDIAADGKILKTEIVRWAGYGLDESVAETVRKMNWRPAERNGKSLPVRILLRYNFKDIEDEES